MPREKFIVTDERLNLEGELAQKLTYVSERPLRGRTVYLYKPSLEDLNSFGEVESNIPNTSESILQVIRQNNTPINAQIVEADDSNELDELMNNLKLGGRRRRRRSSRSSRKSKKSKKSKKSRKSRK